MTSSLDFRGYRYGALSQVLKGLKSICSSLDRPGDISIAGQHGICYNLSVRIQKSSTTVHDILSKVWKHWPGFSGDLYYPVRSPEESISNRDYFQGCSDLWYGTYGRDRRELLRFLIVQLEDHLTS